MNINELYMLNRALDGKDILFLTTYKSLNISALMTDAVKERMIRKGLLSKCNEFSEHGLILTNRLLKYKQARKHIKLNHLFIGIINEKESVLIQWYPFLLEYTINMINSMMITSQIVESYDFLSREALKCNHVLKECTLEELTDTYNLSSDFFHLGTQSMGNNTAEIYFRFEDKLFVYDCVKHVLQPLNQQDMIDKINIRTCLL